jgi:hypothetical protein
MAFSTIVSEFDEFFSKSDQIVGLTLDVREIVMSC